VLTRSDQPGAASELMLTIKADDGSASTATFGIAGGCYLRISYGALDADTVATGVGRLVSGLRALISA